MAHLPPLASCLVLLSLLTASASASDTRHLLLVTLDGLRWQEVFTGGDQRLMTKLAGQVDQPRELRRQFHRETAEERRRALLPFFWNTIAREGQVFGDPEAESVVRVTNGKYFSYPGYHELLCGFADPQIASNEKKNNPNITVLEWLHLQPEFRQRVAAFTSWDVFSYILHSERSGIYVNAGWQPLPSAGTAEQTAVFRQLASELPHYWAGVRYDAFTMQGALTYLREQHPRVFYVALGETDDWAHAGRYDLYLQAARRSDDYLRRLWETVQSLPNYKDCTTLVLTTDHGRGDGREGWKSHGAHIAGSESMWIAVMGPDTAPRGVMAGTAHTQAQVAATVAALLGRDFTAHDPRIATPIDSVLAVAVPPTQESADASGP